MQAPRRAGRRAALTASLLSGAFLFLLLSRSEIRKTLLAQPLVLLGATAVVWLLSYALSRRAGRAGRSGRQRKRN